GAMPSPAAAAPAASLRLCPFGGADSLHHNGCVAFPFRQSLRRGGLHHFILVIAASNCWTLDAGPCWSDGFFTARGRAEQFGRPLGAPAFAPGLRFRRRRRLGF